MRFKALSFIAGLMMLAVSSVDVFAHAFPEQNNPGAGATLTQPPAVVSILFDSEIEPIFSKLIVKNAQGAQVSLGNGSVDPRNSRNLSTRLMNAGKGVYHVYWSVIARDGHHTEGDYTFTVQ